MKYSLLERRSLALLALVGLLSGLLLVGVFAFGGSTVMAQDAIGVTQDDAGAEDERGENEAGEDAAEGPDVPISGPALASASAAALDYLGAGRVTDTEVGDEEGFYEIEVTLGDGRQVDVHLDEAFNVLGHEND